MRLTLRQLSIFTAVADEGSTTAASLRIALSQSATSGALNELESLLGARLFDRVGKRLLLNDAGRLLLPQARAVLRGASAIEEQFGVGLKAGRGGIVTTQLRLGASTTIGNYLLPGLIARYQQAWPEARFDVRIGNTGDIAASVARHEVDLGLVEGPCHEAEVLAHPWLEDELVIIASPAHPLVREGTGRRLGLKALRQVRWLLREPGSGTREAVEHALLPHLHQVEEGMQFGSTEAIKQAAAESLGLSCLSLSAVRDLIALGRLIVVETSLPKLVRRFYLLHHRRKQPSPNLQRFVAHCEGPARSP